MVQKNIVRFRNPTRVLNFDDAVKTPKKIIAYFVVFSITRVCLNNLITLDVCK